MNYLNCANDKQNYPIIYVHPSKWEGTREYNLVFSNERKESVSINLTWTQLRNLKLAIDKIEMPTIW